MRTLTPRQLALAFAVFFMALGVVARYATKEPHPTYSLGAFGLAAMWLGLAWVSSDNRRK